MRQSTKKETQEITKLIFATRANIEELLHNGKKVHVIWDFDGVLANSRSDDVFALSNGNLKTYFAHEERLLFQSPEEGPWLLPIAHNADLKALGFSPECFTQDIITSRSSYLATRVHIFCLSWQLEIRWMLFLGHQSKKESYRIILKSLKNDPDYSVFCVDDSVKHIETFKETATEECMQDRAFGIASPVIRNYTKKNLKEYFARVMNASGNNPIRVRDPSNDFHGFLVLPEGVNQFHRQINDLVSQQHSEGHHFELRNAFVNVYGEVGKGHFETEAELENAMREFILDRFCP